MKQMLDLVAGILVRATPTFVLVILLHWYLKKVLFQPLERVMAERRKRTQGAVEDSESSLAQVRLRFVEYEKALGDARIAIYQEQDASRQRLLQHQAKSVDTAKEAASKRMEEFRADLVSQAQNAKNQLTAEADRLATEIAEAILAGKGR